MKTLSCHLRKALKRAAILVPLLLLLLGGVQQAQAQLVSKWLAVGSLHSRWSELGLRSAQSYPNDTSPLWEGLEEQSGWGYKMEEWVWVGNIRGQNGDAPPTLLEVDWEGGEALGQEYWSKTPFELISKRPPTEVLVDGLPSFLRIQNIDEVDSNLPADRMIEANYGSWMGVDVRTRIYAYGAEPHDDYNLLEITYTNTGNTDQDEEIEEERPLKGVFVTREREWAGFPRYGGEATWARIKSGRATAGARTLETVDDTDYADYDLDFTSIYMWAGYQPEFTTWDTRGIPIVRRTDNDVDPWDTTGRLSSGGMAFYADVYAAAEATSGPPPDGYGEVSAPDAGDEQPSSTQLDRGKAPGVAGETDWQGYDAINPKIEAPGHWPPPGSFATEFDCPPEDFPDAQTWEQRMANCDVYRQGAGREHYMGYGPYDLEPGEHFTIVQAIGVNGLTRKARFEIGQAFKENWQSFQPEAPIEYDANGDGEITNTEIDGAEGDEVMSKNMWVMQSRDTVFQTIRDAISVWEAGLNVAERPVQPASFTVDSRADRIELNWELYADAPVPDSFAIYRTDTDYEMLHEHAATVPASGGERSYTYRDTTVARGVGYYYYLQAIDAVENDPSGVTEPGTVLRSNRYWTQTYSPARLVRGPGEELADTRVVPNPLNINASDNIRYPDQNGNRLGFLDVPEFARIRIYTELGELVRTINHTNGSGDEYWNLTTDSNQAVQSGIYLAVIEKMDENGEMTGNQITRRFVIIR